MATVPSHMPKATVGKIAPTFSVIFKHAWRLWIPNAFPLALYLVIPAALGFIFGLVGFASIELKEEGFPISVPWYFWVWLAVLIVLEIVFGLALTRAVQGAARKKTYVPQENIAYGFRRFFPYLALNIRALFYLLVRGGLLILIAIIGFVVVNVMSQGGFASVFHSIVDAASAQAITPEFPEFGGTFPEFGQRALGLVIANFILGIAALAGIIIMFVLLPRLFAVSFVFVDKDASSKEALQGSVKIGKGHWGKIVGNLILFGIIIALPIMVITGVSTAALASDPARADIISNVLGTVYQLFSVPFSVVFGFLLYDGLLQVKKA